MPESSDLANFVPHTKLITLPLVHEHGVTTILHSRPYSNFYHETTPTTKMGRWAWEIIVAHHIIDKLLNSIVIADVNPVQEYGEIDVSPHVVVMFDMGVKAVSTALKLMASNTTDEAEIILVLLSTKLKQKVVNINYCTWWMQWIARDS